MFWPQIISICLKRGKQGQPGLRRRAIASRSLLVMLKFDGKAVAAALCAASAAFLPLGVQAQAAVGPHADLCKNNASAVLVPGVGWKSRTGNVRIQLYAKNPGTFLDKGQWLERIAVPVTGNGPVKDRNSTRPNYSPSCPRR